MIGRRVEECRSESVPLVLGVNGEPGQQGDGEWEVGRLALAHCRGGTLVLELAGHERVVAEHRAMRV